MGFANFRYSKEEWVVIKILTLSLWVYPIIKVIGRYHSIPFPEGACLLFDFTFITRAPWSVLIIFATIIFSICYVFERYMVLSTLILTLISIIFFSIERSNGIYHRKELLSMLFLVQFIAYLQYQLSARKFQPETTAFNLAILYSIQIIAAAYVIAGMTKLGDSGLGWITDSPNAAVQVLKSFSQKSIDLESTALMEYGRWMTWAFVEFPNAVRVIMALALGLELFALIAVLSKKSARWYGALLLLMHVGMFFLSGIVLIAFTGLVMIYLINVPGILIALWHKFRPAENSPDRNLVGSETTTGRLDSFSLLKQQLIFFTLPIAYIALTFLAGENHPFSKFRMYSQFPAVADYFYLADSNNYPVSCYHNFNFRTNELKDMIQAKVKNYGLDRNNNEALAKPAMEVLNFVVESNRTNSDLKKFGEVKLFRHEIERVGQAIKEKDIVLAEVKIAR